MIGIGRKSLLLTLLLSNLTTYGALNVSKEGVRSAAKKSGPVALYASGFALASVASLSSIALGASLGHFNYNLYCDESFSKDTPAAPLYLAGIPGTLSLGIILAYMNAKIAMHFAKKVKETVEK